MLNPYSFIDYVLEKLQQQLITKNQTSMQNRTPKVMKGISNRLILKEKTILYIF